jgi:outer membrane protein TolC
MSRTTRFLILSGLALVLSGAGARGEPDPVWPGSDGPRPIEETGGFHQTDRQLARLIRELLESNPEVLSARAASLSRLERVSQESSLPDPRLSYRYFVDTPETRVGSQEQGLEISQQLPWFGKRELQGKRAGHLATGLSWRARDVERYMVAELKHTYFNLAYLQEALAINGDEAELLHRFERIALTRYSTGSGNQQSVIKVQTDISRLADQKIALRERFEIARRRVAELLGKPESRPDLQPISLSLPDLQLDAALLQAEAARNNPGVLASSERIEADRAWIERRQRDSYPDVALGLGWVDVDRRDDPAGVMNPPQSNGKDIWALSVTMNIPVHRGRIRAGVAEAEHSLLSNQHSMHGTRDRVQSGVQRTVLRLESLGERARLYRDLLIHQAEESLASAEAAYTTNRQGFLDLLDAERVLFQVRLTYHRLVADYWVSLADIERAIARPFPQDGSPTEEGAR